MSNLSQNLNSTAPFNTTLPSIIVTNNVWLYLDNIVRIVSLVVHILYFLVVFTHRELTHEHVAHASRQLHWPRIGH